MKKQSSCSAPNFYVVGMRAKLDEGGGRILLGDNTGGRAVMLRPIRFQCVGVWILTLKNLN